METMRRFLGLGGRRDAPDGRVLPFLAVVGVLLVTDFFLERPWWQELLIATAAIFAVGMLAGLWSAKRDK